MHCVRMFYFKEEDILHVKCGMVVCSIIVHVRPGSCTNNNSWHQCYLLGQLSSYVLVGHGIVCLLSFFLLVVVVRCYALHDVLDIVISSS